MTCVFKHYFVFVGDSYYLVQCHNQPEPGSMTCHVHSHCPDWEEYQVSLGTEDAQPHEPSCCDLHIAEINKNECH